MWPLVGQLGFLNIYAYTLFIQLHMWYAISKLKTKQGVEYNQQYPHFMTHTTTETTNKIFRDIKKHPFNSSPDRHSFELATILRE